ncbi:MAG: hypothetical protein AAGA30_17020, partial [Planctomycetota bacterium]
MKGAVDGVWRVVSEAASVQRFAKTEAASLEVWTGCQSSPWQEFGRGTLVCETVALKVCSF